MLNYRAKLAFRTPFQWGAFAGVELRAGGQPHGVLLGRSFLNQCIMIYDGIREQVTVATPKQQV
jgi:hypothetical protein